MSLNILITDIQLQDLQERKMIEIPGLSWAEPKQSLLAEIQRGGADCSYAKPTFFAIRNDFFSMMSNHQYKVNALDAHEKCEATVESFLYRQYEIQVLETFCNNNKIYVNGQAGAIYKQLSPLVNSLIPPREWNTYNTVFTAPTINSDGTYKINFKVTVLLNGILV